MKKLMALLLAATTAISMFAGSVSAIDFENEAAFTGAYIPAKVEFSTGTITVTQDYLDKDGNVLTSTATIKGGVDFVAFVEHIELGEPYGAPEDYSTYVALNPGLMTDKYGKIYMYDYLEDPSGETEREQQKDLDKFADAVAEILSTPSIDKGKLDGEDIDDFAKLWKEAYSTTPSTQDTAVRYDAETQLRANRKAVSKIATNGVLKDGIYDDGDVKDYNAKALFKAIYDADAKKDTTSYIVYLNAEYERVITEISYADQTTIMDTYYDKLDKVTSYVEDDFTAAGWREVQEYLEEAEELAAEANSVYDWQDAIGALDNAIAVRGKAVDYTDLQDALADLFVGDGKASDIKPTLTTLTIDGETVTVGVYAGDVAKYVYLAKDFTVRNSLSQEWVDFAGEYDGYTDAKKTEKSAFTEAYGLWRSARSSATSVKQSEIDEALEELLAAVDALVSNADDVDEWLLVKLQAAVDAAKALNEADFNTTTRKWEKFQEDVADAEEVLAKSKPSVAEVIRVTNKLAESEGTGSYYDIKATAKKVSSANEKELKELIRTADRLMSNISTQTGAQVAALREAVEDADEVYTLINAPQAWKKATISEVDAALADLQAAIDNFNNPQGWYKEDGKWYYGVGAEVYGDNWFQIGETWYMFNADGSLKQSEWFQVEGKWYWANENGGLAVGFAKVDGKWYFFDQGNAMKTGWVKVDNNWYYFAASGAMVTGWNWIGGSCYYFYNNGAMAANTTIGGYTVDANGAWVK